MHRRGVIVAAVISVLGVLASTAQEARGGEPDAVWRAMFKRSGMLPAPAGAAATPEKLALGARLFSDPRLSGQGARACSTCHEPGRAFTDGRRRARGLTGAPLLRNTPSLWNLAWGKSYFWDGRASSLEEQAQMPILAGDEMGGDWPTILARLREETGTVVMFRAAFDETEPVTEVNVLGALAAYVRSLVSPPTRFDAWIDGDSRALSPNELRGFQLFTGKAACVLCHVGWRFTNDKFHDIGLPGTDGGRSLVAGGTPGLMAFKTPSLRELTHTAPYMHDGSLATLQAVVKHYAGGHLRRPSLAPSLRRDLRLTTQERSDLVAFLRTLSSEKDPARGKRAGSR